MREPYRGPVRRARRRASTFVAPERCEIAMRLLRRARPAPERHRRRHRRARRVPRPCRGASTGEFGIRGRALDPPARLLPRAGAGARATPRSASTSRPACRSRGARATCSSSASASTCSSDLIPLRRMLDAGMTVACGTDWGPKNVFEHVALADTHEFCGSGRRNDGPGAARDARGGARDVDARRGARARLGGHRHARAGEPRRPDRRRSRSARVSEAELPARACCGRCSAAVSCGTTPLVDSGGERRKDATTRPRPPDSARA